MDTEEDVGEEGGEEGGEEYVGVDGGVVVIGGVEDELICSLNPYKKIKFDGIFLKKEDVWHNKMEWIVKERVLHGSYDSKEEITKEMLHLADQYEGVIPRRMGWNIPFSFISQQEDSYSKRIISKYGKEAEYLIIYPKNDLQTKKHELLHAKYGMDESYREMVLSLWNSLSLKDKSRVHNILCSLHYPDNSQILLDEFQAYYYTEKASFFGILREIKGGNKEKRVKKEKGGKKEKEGKKEKGGKSGKK